MNLKLIIQVYTPFTQKILPGSKRKVSRPKKVPASSLFSFLA